jgi:hypothetical protein
MISIIFLMSIHQIDIKDINSAYYIADCQDDTGNNLRIYQVIFRNGLEFYIASNYEIKTFDARNILGTDYNMFNGLTPEEIRQMIKERFGQQLRFSESKAVKIHNYFKNNYDKIKQVLGL